ncbi:MAG: DinB family protein [Rhizobacter sp.]|nr:DinB family protein [Chlorobiales bacterium]
MPSLSELIDTYSRTPGKLEFAVDGLSESKVKWKPNPKKWSIREILCHLADSETVALSRIHLIVASSPDAQPVLVAYDQDELVSRYAYNAQDELTALQTFKYLRKHAAALLKSLPESAFQKTGNHTERGKISIMDLLELYTKHGETHLRQIEEIKELLKNDSGY